MAEQSHKREMMDAVRGDFERLRARRERSRQRAEPQPAQPERLVLTPAQAQPPSVPEAQPATEPEAQIQPFATAPEQEARRSWPWGRRRRG